MFQKILSNAVKDKVGTSKVVDVFKDAYDYIIGNNFEFISLSFHEFVNFECKGPYYSTNVSMQIL